MSTVSLVGLVILNGILLMVGLGIRSKYPNRYWVGTLLCIAMPAWGQLYVSSKSNWWFWVFLVVWISGMKSELSTRQDLGAFSVTLGLISSVIICIRISKAKSRSVILTGVN